MLQDVENARLFKVGKTNRGDLRFYGDPSTGEIWIQALAEKPGEPNIDELYGSKNDALSAMDRYLDKLLAPT